MWKRLLIAFGVFAALNLAWIGYQKATEYDVADMPGIERQVAFDLQQGYGVSKPVVSCPDEEVRWAPGETFTCDAWSAKDKADTVAITVMMGEDGAYDWAPEYD